MPSSRLTPPPTEELILVDPRNRCLGHAAKRLVHEQGLRHRAFSIFLVDREGRLLLQRRARTKYHSGGLWANSCCGHPRPGERTLPAAQRRLGEELGATSVLQLGFCTRYRAEVGDGLVENEIVYVYFGSLPEQINPSPAEVSAVTCVTLSDLASAVRRRPANYAAWLRHYLEMHRGDLAAGIARVARASRRSRSRRQVAATT